jgi:hypothetical protein
MKNCLAPRLGRSVQYFKGVDNLTAVWKVIEAHTNSMEVSSYRIPRLVYSWSMDVAQVQRYDPVSRPVCVYGELDAM